MCCRCCVKAIERALMALVQSSFTDGCEGWRNYRSGSLQLYWVMPEEDSDSLLEVTLSNCEMPYF